MTLLIFIFAFSSVLGNYSYAEVNLYYLGADKRALDLFRVVVLLSIAVGAIAALASVWAMADVAMASWRSSTSSPSSGSAGGPSPPSRTSRSRAAQDGSRYSPLWATNACPVS